MKEMLTFKYECSLPLGFVEVIATPEGTGIIIIDEMTQDEISFDVLSKHDQLSITDWVNYYRDMRRMDLENREVWNELHEKSYVDWVNGGSK